MIIRTFGIYTIFQTIIQYVCFCLNKKTLFNLSRKSFKPLYNKLDKVFLELVQSSTIVKKNYNNNRAFVFFLRRYDKLKLSLNYLSY